MGTGSSLGVKCGQGVLLTTHSFLVPRSWKSRAIPLPTPGPHRACNGITLPFLILWDHRRIWGPSLTETSLFGARLTFYLPLPLPLLLGVQFWEERTGLYNSFCHNVLITEMQHSYDSRYIRASIVIRTENINVVQQTVPILLKIYYLILIQQTWTIWWAPNNASKWQMGFNLAFRGLIPSLNSRSCWSYRRVLGLHDGRYGLSTHVTRVMFQRFYYPT